MNAIAKQCCFSGFTHFRQVKPLKRFVLALIKKIKTLTPSLPQPVHTYTPADSVFDGPITNLLSILRILIEILSHAHVKGGGGGGAFMISNLALLLVVFRARARQPWQ